MNQFGISKEDAFRITDTGDEFVVEELRDGEATVVFDDGSRHTEDCESIFMNLQTDHYERIANSGNTAEEENDAS